MIEKHTVGRCLTVAFALLLASSGASAAVPAAPVQPVAPSTDTANASPELRANADHARQSGEPIVVNVTKRYSLAADGENVTVTLLVENPEVVERAGIERIGFGFSDRDERVTKPGDFRERNGDYLMTDYGENASITFEVALNERHASESRGETWALFEGTTPDPRHLEPQNGEVRIAENVTHEVEGEGLVRARPGTQAATVFLGEHEIHPPEATGDAIEIVVPAAAELRTDPAAIRDLLRRTRQRVDGGVTDRRVTGYALPTVDGPGGWAWDSQFQVEDEISVHRSGSTWTHEYLHTTERVGYGSLGSSMKWFVEGYAEYGDELYTTQTGFAEWESFSANVGPVMGSRHEAAAATLSDPKRRSGVAVLAAIDYQIRSESDGRYDLQDVVRAVHDHERAGETVELNDFARFVGAVSNGTVETRAKQWIRGDRPVPELWSEDRHAAVFGEVPRFEHRVDEVRIGSGRDVTRSDAIDGQVLSPGDAVEVDVTVRNVGPTEGTYGTALRTRVVRGDANRTHAWGRLSPGRAATVSFTRTFSERKRVTVESRAGGGTGNLYVAADSAVALTPGADHDSPAAAATVTRANSSLVVFSHGYRRPVTVAPVGGTPRIETQTTLDQRLAIDPANLTLGTTYAVTIGNGSDAATRYATVAPEPVAGAVPRDPDGDGLYEDVDGNGVLDSDDWIALVDDRDEPAVTRNAEAYDFDGDGDVDTDDASALAVET